MISAKIIAHSVNPKGKEIATFEWEYPRFIHGEVMTHRRFSRNAASSRAIPAKKIREQVWNRPAMPIHWGANQSGMQAESSLSGLKKSFAKRLWKAGAKLSCIIHAGMEKVGLHKQICNRILEPWMLMKVVVTSTEWANFLWLRDHDAAQPEIQQLAKLTADELLNSIPRSLGWGEWHLPYITDAHRELGMDLQKAISISCCAQVSYRALDDSVAKAYKLTGMLLRGDRVHASPFEHLAKAVDSSKHPSALEAKRIGFTHIDVEGDYWSGNLCEWVQHRQLLDGHDVVDLHQYISEKKAA